MKALITSYHDSATCAWCAKSTEAVTVEFGGGFLQKSDLCFRCLQQSVRVHHRQSQPAPPQPAESQPAKPAREKGSGGNQRV